MCVERPKRPAAAIPNAGPFSWPCASCLGVFSHTFHKIHFIAFIETPKAFLIPNKYYSYYGEHRIQHPASRSPTKYLDITHTNTRIYCYFCLKTFSSFEHRLSTAVCFVRGRRLMCDFRAAFLSRLRSPNATAVERCQIHQSSL